MEGEILPWLLSVAEGIYRIKVDSISVDISAVLIIHYNEGEKVEKF